MTTPIFCAESRTRVHDYRRQGWGHALHMIEIEHLDIKPSWWRALLGEQPKAVSRLSCLAHGYNVHEGDEILVPMQSGKTARFVLADIEHCGEPKDMFKVKAADFIGYLGEQPA